jgi:diguanylate cyclase (GGDEF)-like protein
MADLRKTKIQITPFYEDDEFVVDRRFPCLIVLQGPNVGARYNLLDLSTTLGRDPNSTIPIFDDIVSWNHACIEYDQGNNMYVLKDLESTNGTLVNGRRIKKVELHDGDKLFLGKVVLKFTFQDALEGEFHEKLEQLLSTDELTGLMSKRRFDEVFSREVMLALSQGYTLSILVMDMDGLKLVNDTYGHQMGSHTIATVGKLIGDMLKKGDFATRFGGDEYSACLVNQNKAEAVKFAENIRKHVRSLEIKREQARTQVTISIGVASLPEDATTPEELFRLADLALYRAKKAGRDTVST